jgi:hypothetical protein
MESRVDDVGSIADVMQPCRSDESFALQRQRRCQMLSLSCPALSGQGICG